ncbi:MAG: DUF559 domain-containing protein [Parvibaculum sp.]|nr:DUF559 domain-containing protein [Parvibaculum sp.]
MPSQFARFLRKNQTDAERKLWRELRYLKQYGFHFRRQVPMRQYVTDFICHSAKLVIELDGGQHDEIKAIASDARRTAWLETQGYKVLRFWNNDVLLNVEGVQTAIRAELRLDCPPTQKI